MNKAPGSSLYYPTQVLHLPNPMNFRYFCEHTMSVRNAKGGHWQYSASRCRRYQALRGTVWMAS